MCVGCECGFENENMKQNEFSGFNVILMGIGGVLEEQIKRKLEFATEYLDSLLERYRINNEILEALANTLEGCKRKERMSILLAIQEFNANIENYDKTILDIMEYIEELESQIEIYPCEGCQCETDEDDILEDSDYYYCCGCLYKEKCIDKPCYYEDPSLYQPEVKQTE